jgi:hypothetical protein
MGSQSVYATPVDYARFLALWLEGGRHAGGSLISREGIDRILTPVSPMTQIGSTDPFPTGFPDQEVWHGRMAMLYRTAPEANDDPPEAFGYSGSDGTFAWVWPDLDLMVLFFSQSRGQSVQVEFEATLRALLLDAGEQGGPMLPPPGGGTDDELGSLIGRYRADFGAYQNAEFTVVRRGDALAVDIPGQMAFILDGPDEDGWRTFSLTKLVAVSFQKNASGEVEAMRLAQTTVLPRRGDSLHVAPDRVRAWIGGYELPAGQGVLSIRWKDEGLVLEDPSGREIPLAEVDSPGVWETTDSPPKRISFDLDPVGTVLSMRLTEVVRLPRIR